MDFPPDPDEFSRHIWNIRIHLTPAEKTLIEQQVRLTDNTLYGIKNGQLSPVSGSSSLLTQIANIEQRLNLTITDAPADGKKHARQNGAWTEVTSGYSFRKLRTFSSNGSAFSLMPISNLSPSANLIVGDNVVTEDGYVHTVTSVSASFFEAGASTLKLGAGGITLAEVNSAIATKIEGLASTDYVNNVVGDIEALLARI